MDRSTAGIATPADDSHDAVLYPDEKDAEASRSGDEIMLESAMPCVDQPALSKRYLQLLALLVVHEQLNVTAAARLMCLSRSSGSRLTNRLVDLGYASRKADDADHRITYISPTTAGRAVDAAMRYRIAAPPPAGRTRPRRV